MMSQKRDFFDDFIVPFAVGHPEWAEALRHWPPGKEAYKEIQNYSEQSLGNQIVFFLHLAKYAKNNVIGQSVYNASLDYLSRISVAIYQQDPRERYEDFRDSVTEFLADAKPEMRAYFSLLFSRIEKEGAIPRLNFQDPGSPPAPV